LPAFEPGVGGSTVDPELRCRGWLRPPADDGFALLNPGGVVRGDGAERTGVAPRAVHAAANLIP
jgi:hypothetical protein